MRSLQTGRSIYITGGILSIIVLIGIFLDVIIGNITGGDLSALPQSAAGRFLQIKENPFQGLYNLDLLNVINQILIIPVYVSLFFALKDNPYSLLALAILLSGTVIMATNNAALPMLDLCKKYFSTTDETLRSAYASAGEALLAKGNHGSGGMFFGFLLPNLSGLIISMVMLGSSTFSRLNSWLGITGSILMMVYVILVTFVPGIEKSATAFAMPGGLLLMAWMIMYTIRLFKFDPKKTT